MNTQVQQMMSNSHPLPEWCSMVRQYASEMKFGQIVITVHEGQVTQVEKTERTRFTQPSPRKQVTS